MEYFQDVSKNLNMNMTYPLKNYLRSSISKMALFTLLLMMAVPFTAMSQLDRYSVATGNWNVTSTWSATSGGASGASVPIASDIVFVENGYTVTVTDAQAADSITVQNGHATLDTKLIVDDSGVLTVSYVLIKTPTLTKKAQFFTQGTSGSPGQTTVNGNVRVEGYDAKGEAQMETLESGQLTINGDLDLWAEGSKKAKLNIRGTSSATVTGDFNYTGNCGMYGSVIST